MTWSIWFSTPREDQQPVLDFIKKEQKKREEENAKKQTTLNIR